jgi:hypothetical protein
VKLPLQAAAVVRANSRNTLRLGLPPEQVLPAQAKCSIPGYTWCGCNTTPTTYACCPTDGSGCEGGTVLGEPYCQCKSKGKGDGKGKPKK